MCISIHLLMRLWHYWKGTSGVWGFGLVELGSMFDIPLSRRKPANRNVKQLCQVTDWQFDLVHSILIRKRHKAGSHKAKPLVDAKICKDQASNAAFSFIIGNAGGSTKEEYRSRILCHLSIVGLSFRPFLIICG